MLVNQPMGRPGPFRHEMRFMTGAGFWHIDKRADIIGRQCVSTSEAAGESFGDACAIGPIPICSVWGKYMECNYPLCATTQPTLLKQS